MKKLYLLTSFTLLFANSLFAQQQSVNPGLRAKAIIQFTRVLTEAATAYPPQLSHETDADGKIDAPFRIDDKGILSVTFRYPVGTSFALSKMTVPVDSLKTVFNDYYVGFECSADVVTISEGEVGSRELKNSYNTMMFHIARPGDGPQGGKIKARLEQGLQTFRDTYK
ncbi:hypothetical protein DVR12_04100 [Chitinophaga silvatica]|uniref:DUF4468 domain-containing protein n=1 Tax=Chitinophaga silvatica TaxID=2282649 RepID=A0A3E1YHS6_9BACT|nr:hypothetical protein [Chitinophaga silvatica]RFS26973.1 hypothetical protein DVR12_04100 [Chitinophaga silvatica]